MRKSFDLDDDGCYLQPGKKESIEECGFNATAKTILIIHGWTVRHSRLSWHVPMVLLLDLTFEDLQKIPNIIFEAVMEVHVFTFMHLADFFIQSDLHCISRFTHL